MKGDSTRLFTAAIPAVTLLLLLAFGKLAADCSIGDIEVHQGQSAPLPNGIPTYTVSVLNLCSGGCSLSNIHLSCGAFSSARLVNPSVFRRLSINDCLLNDGRPLAPGAVVSFQYANSFSYPLAISSATCVR
ncbi:TPD1 protein homolog 1-like [Curcuma longa]|uniref:TPD1 protein homolog 1-like n=1 Tax=Curcuma longa TaxID=136217 RepID=UPI003D9F184D